MKAATSRLMMIISFFRSFLLLCCIVIIDSFCLNASSVVLVDCVSMNETEGPFRPKRESGVDTILE